MLFNFLKAILMLLGADPEAPQYFYVDEMAALDPNG